MSDAPTSAGPQDPGAAAKPGRSDEVVKSRVTLLTVIGAAIAIGAFVVYGIPRIREHLKNRDVLEKVTEASKHMANEEWVSAVRLLSQASKIDPANPEPLRLMARSLEQLPGGSEFAAHLWQQLIAAHQATTRDRASCAIILLRGGSRDEAGKILESIPEEEQNDRPALELKSAFARLDGNTNLAEKLLRAAYQADIKNPDAKLKLALLDLSSPFAEVQETANKKLWEIAQSGVPEAVNAMRALAEQTKLTVPQATTLRQLLEAAPNVSDERRLPIVSGILRALPAQRESIIAAEAAQHQGNSFEDTATFIRWLAGNREHERLLSLVPPGQAVRTAELFLSYAAALESTRRWKDLRELIRKNPSIPIPPATVAMILAHCAYGLNEPADLVRGHLQDGIKLAWIIRDRTMVMTLGNTADDYGMPEVAIEAFNLLASQPPFKLPVLERLLQMHQKMHDLPAMIETIHRCRQEQPDNPAYLESWCYLKLLEGSEMEKAADIIERHLASHPDRLPAVSFIQAFAAYRYGDLKLAERKTRLVSGHRLPPGQRAVLAGILQACGKEADAFQIAEKVPDNMVLAEERRLLRTAQ